VGEIFISHASADRAVATRIGEGIRESGHSIFLDSDRVDGIDPGAAWQRTLFRELRICDAVVFLNSRGGQESMWCHSELVVATELGKRVYSLDLGPDLSPHPLLRSLQSIRFDSTIDASIRQLVRSLDSDGLAGSARLRWEPGRRPPYPGLAAMNVADAGVFFGREDEVQRLMARVDGPLGQRDGDLVIVIGPSGTGKSSLVRAGLAARLGALQSPWAVARPFEPGIRPLDTLLMQLASLVPGQLTESKCRERLRIEGLAAFGEWLANHKEAKRLLITVDQAEQLVTVPPPHDCEEFLSVLRGGLGPGSPVTVVMTVRSDRFGEMQRLPAIGSLIHAPVPIAPISRSQLAAVIEKPAKRADLSFEPGLVSRIIDEAVRGSSGETSDALPFLAFVLRAMYDLANKDDRTALTEDDYERVGRIDGAIKQRTLAAEASLLPNSEPVLEHLLLRFVTLSKERGPAARPVPRQLLTTAEQAVVERLEDQRLLVADQDVVRLAHERLIDAWPRLAKAVAASRDDLLMLDTVKRHAKDWKDGHGGLLGRDATAEASSWLASRAEPGIDQPDVGEYVRASQAALNRRLVLRVAASIIIAVLTIGASVFAYVAKVQRSDAQSEEMAAEATNLLPSDGPLAMLLSLQAYKRAHTLQAESALIQAVQQPLDDLLISGSRVNSAAFSPDGRTLAVGGQDGHIGLWKVATGRRTATLAEGSSAVGVAFSPDGQTLAVGDAANNTGLWDVATGRRTATLPEGSEISGVAFSPDRQTLAVGDSAGRVRLWNVARGQQIAALAEGNSVSSVVFSPDRKTLAVGDAAGRIGLWDVARGRRAATLTEGSPVSTVAFSPDGQTLAVGDSAGRVGLWEVARGRRAATLAEGSPVSTVAFSSDGQTLAAGDSAGRVGLWDAARGKLPASLAEDGPVASVAFSPNGQTLAAGDQGSHVGLWDVATGRRTATLTDGGSLVNGVAFSVGGQTLAAGDSGGHVGLWDVATGRRTATLNEGDPVVGVAFSPEGQTLAAGDLSGRVGLWDVATRQRTASLPDGDGSAVLGVAFSPDGQTLAAGDDAGRVGLWDVATGRRTASLPEGSAVFGVAFSPDGRTLAAGDDAGRVGLWEVATGRRTTTLTDGSPVQSVAFSPNGPTLVTGDRVGNVGAWDTVSGQRFANLPEGGSITSLAFPPHGQMLAIGGVNGNIVLLRLNLTHLTQRLFTHLICGKVRGNMTRAQWADYAPGQPYQKTCS
jgi:WD40 repeat protein